MLKIQHFIYLDTLDQTHSIHKASDVLFISPQAMSKAIQKLEADYGFPFLDRSAHGVSLTEPAKQMMEMARPMLRTYQEIEQFLRSIPSNQSQEQTIRIAAIKTYRDYYLPDARYYMMEHYPYVSLEIKTMGTMEVIQAVTDNKYDLGFLGIPFINNHPLYEISESCEYTQFQKFHYGFFVGNQSPLAKYNSISISAALQYPIVFLEEQMNSTLDKYAPYLLLSHFGKVNYVIADSVNYMNRLIVNNKGIGFSSILPNLNETFLENDLGSVKPIRDNVFGTVGYLKSNMLMDTPETTALLNKLKSIIHM